jgi:hypothetical protein
MSISTPVLPRLFSRGSDYSHAGISIHIPGIRIHILLESLFSSFRNLYSHVPEYALGEGEIIEEKLFYDLVGMLRQIGVMPSQGAVKAA